MKRVLSILVACAVCVATRIPDAGAQDLGGVFNLGQLGQDLAFGTAMKVQAEQDAKRLKGRASQTRTRTERRVLPKGSTRFRTNFASRKQNLAQFVAQVRKTDPQGADRLEDSFRKSDPIAAIAPALRRYNLRTDDVADAATVYLISAWYGVRGSTQDPAAPYVNGVRQQMRNVMLATPTFGSASDATKQQMAEAMLIQTMVVDLMVNSAKGNPTQMANVKNAIAQGARSSFQMDLTQMKLTNRGFGA